MKTRTIKLIIAILFIGQFIFAQGWEGVFDIQNETLDIGEKILEADNGDYLISGEQMTSGHQPYIFVSRISPNGDEIWSKSYNTPYINDTINNPYLYHGGITKASDGGYIVTGTLYTGLPYTMIVMKIDETNGDTLWTKNHIMPDSLTLWEFHDIITVSDGGYIVVGNTSQGDVNSVVVKIDFTGELLWIKQTPYGESAAPYSVIESSDGNVVITGKRWNDNASAFVPYIQKIDLNGDEIWINNLSLNAWFGITDVKETSDNGFIIATSTSIIKTDSQGNLEWENQDIPFFLNGVSEANDGGFIFTGRFEKSDSDDDLILLKTDSSGEILWFKLFGGPWDDYGLDVIQTSDGSIVSIGQTSLNESFLDGDLYVVKTNSSGNLFDNVVKGRVFWDENFNCENNLGELGFSMHLIQVIGNDTVYSFTNQSGEYELGLDTGSYAIRSILPNPYWETCIGDPFPFEINNVSDTVIVDLPSQVVIECPYLEVDISTPLLRRCFENIYDVNYCNSGTAIAEDAVVTVILDPFLEYQSASIDLTAQNGDTLIFEIGDVEVYECGSFSILTYLDCDSTVTGQTHCVTALISPDSICLPVDPLWSGASLMVNAKCTGDSLFFNIENIGDEDMFSPQNFIITEDVIMYDEGEVELLSGQSMQVFAEATNGSTWRLEVDQVGGHPGDSNPSVVVEGCVPFGTPFTQYFTNIFPQDDGDPFVSIDCQESVNSYDPNDKIGFPTGWDNEHFIERNEDIEYKIRFQNTGADTAFNVVIKDLISSHLDFTTFRPGASSHPYRLGFEGPDLLTFTFENIMLPDSNVNEAASHGFVKFKISQKKDLSLGTVIYNEALIYFDFNEPVITNETFHTVAEPLITVTIEPSFLEKVTIDAYPNPFNESTRIEVKGADFNNLKLHLFDVHGRLIASHKAENSQFILQRNGLTTGIYFYRIESDGQLIGVGKLLVQ